MHIANRTDVCVCVCVYVYIYTRTHTHTHTMCVCVCIYIYIYTRTHTHTQMKHRWPILWPTLFWEATRSSRHLLHCMYTISISIGNDIAPSAAIERANSNMTDFCLDRLLLTMKALCFFETSVSIYHRHNVHVLNTWTYSNAAVRIADLGLFLVSFDSV